MAEQLAFFFVAMACTIVVGKAAQVLLSPFLPPTYPQFAGADGRMTIVIATLIAITVVIILAQGMSLSATYLPDSHYFEWVTSGRVSALLAGFCAGLVVAVTLRALATLQSDASYTAVAILGIGPAGAILVLGFLGMPGIRQGLGISAFEAGGVKLAFENRGNGQPVQQNSPGPLDYGIARDPRFTRHALALQRMVGGVVKAHPMYQYGDPGKWENLAVTKAEDFPDLPFFVREALYLNVIDEMEIPIGRQPQRPKEPSPIATPPNSRPFFRQVQLLRSLAPAVACISYYHQIFPDRFAVKHLTTNAMEALEALEAHLETASWGRLQHGGRWNKFDPPAADIWPTTAAGLEPSQSLVQLLWYRTNRLNEEFTRIARTALGNMPEILAAEDKAGQNWPPWLTPTIRVADCAPDGVPPSVHIRSTDVDPGPAQLWDGASDPSDVILPPYLAMFIARGFASLGDHETGLLILNNWIRYYTAVRDLPISKVGGLKPPQWYYDRAIIEYGLILQRYASPMTREERWFLRQALAVLERDWKINLLPKGPVRKGTWVDTKKSVGEWSVGERGARIRIYALYADLVGGVLQAGVRTRSAEQDDWLRPEDERMATGLLETATRQIAGEPASTNAFRVTTARMSAGLALSRWAIDGARHGQLSAKEVEDTRRRAYRALREALPSLRHMEEEELPSKQTNEGNEGPFRLPGNEWTAHRLTVERELLDLRIDPAQ